MRWERHLSTEKKERCFMEGIKRVCVGHGFVTLPLKVVMESRNGGSGKGVLGIESLISPSVKLTLPQVIRFAAIPHIVQTIYL